MTRTLATIKPKRGRHNDVEQIQVREEENLITVWQWTTKGSVLLRDTEAIDQLVRELIKAGFGGPKPEQQVLHVREEQGE